MSSTSSLTPRPRPRIGLALPVHQRVFAAFFLYAFGLGGFFPRLAEIQRTIQATEGQLGLALIGAATGTLLSLTFGGPFIARVGHRRALLGLLPVLPVCYAVAAHMHSPLAVFLCLLPAGLCMGVIEVIVNLEADRVEHQTGRRIMNRAHAFWSFGFFGAGLLGAGLARLGIGPQAHLLVVVPLVAALVLICLGGFEPAALRERSTADGEAAPRFARPTLGITRLVLLTLSAMVLEGAGFDWSAIYMRDIFGGSAALGGLAVATGAFAQAVTRYVIDPHVERHSPAAVARSLLGVLGLGCLLVTFAPNAGLALLGFALMGAGTSAIFPLAMSAAAQRTDRPAAVNVAALAQTSFVAFLLAPPLLGFVAEHAGLRTSFGIGLPLVLLSLAMCSALSSHRPPR